MDQNLQQTQNLRQEQRLNHEQILSLGILQANIQELNQQIETTVAQNPLLEITSRANEILATDLESPGDERTQQEQNEDNRAKLMEYDENLGEALNKDDNGDYYDNFVADSFIAGTDVESEERRKHFLDSIHVDASFLDDLRLEARVAAKGDKKLYLCLRYVIESLDSSGYLQESDEELAANSGLPADLLHEAVKIVQGFDPPGLGAHDLRECLLLQLERNREKGSLAWDIVDRHLTDLERNRIPEIAAAIDADLDETQEAIRRIRLLAPRPLASCAVNEAQIILPEAEVSWTKEGELTIKMNTDDLPHVALSQTYLEMLEQPNLDKESRSFLNAKKTAAQHFIQILDDRQTTIAKITWAIVRHQPDFFSQGDLALRPLTLATIAEEVGFHESTVSRAIDTKYMMTPFGLRSYKFFFGVKAVKTESENGDEASNLAIRQRIATLIKAENPKKPLSDQKIADLLNRDGINIARRTVAKYRELENIRAASLRKQH